MPIQTVNPATGEVLKTFDPLGAEEIEVRLARAAAAFSDHRRTSFAQRSAWLRAAADLLDADRGDIARTMTTEMGKTLTAAQAEAAKCATGMRFYAEHAEAFLADEPLADPRTVGASRAFARYQPLGPVLAVMPWNFPLWQVVRFAAPALMAGNVGLLKHASNVPQTAQYLEDLFRRAGFPEGCFQTLLIGAGQVEAVLRDPRVAAATVTGSEAAGRSVASIAGDEVKKTVLELGGSDAFVVMPSADVDELVRDAVAHGADVLCGGAPGEGPGWFYPPTVVAGITPAMRVHTEEVFGPVASLYRVPDIDAAVELANATTFGLGSNAWTSDPAEEERFVADLDAGAVFVNGMTTSYPELPFGGVRRSGYGRELGAHGLREFCNVKTVWVA